MGRIMQESAGDGLPDMNKIAGLLYCYMTNQGGYRKSAVLQIP